MEKGQNEGKRGRTEGGRKQESELTNSSAIISATGGSSPQRKVERAS